MRTRRSVLLGLAVAALALAGIATAAVAPPAGNYQWVQPPASGVIVGVVGSPSAQPPASVDFGGDPYVAANGALAPAYHWVQPPASGTLKAFAGNPWAHPSAAWENQHA